MPAGCNEGVCGSEGGKIGITSKLENGGLEVNLISEINEDYLFVLLHVDYRLPFHFITEGPSLFIHSQK